MSYATVASHNTSGYQPKPDPNLLTTPADVSPTTSLPDVDSKLNVVPHDYKDHQETQTSRLNHIPQPEEYTPSPKHTTGPTSKSTTDRRKEKAKKRLDEAEEEGLELWAEAKERILRPGFLGGLAGIVNVGLIGAAGYQLYTRPALRSDTRTLTIAGVSALALFTAEGWVAEAYSQTPAGQEEARKAKEEGAVIYKQTKDIVLRPGVLGGLVGVLNVGILGGVGYASYVNWDQRHWDRRTVSAVTAGLITLFTAEGYLGEQYKEKEYPKRK